jgi:hypothetical protein
MEELIVNSISKEISESLKYCKTETFTILETDIGKFDQLESALELKIDREQA